MLLFLQKRMITQRHDVPFMSLLKSLLTMPLKSSEATVFPHPQKGVLFDSLRFYPNGLPEWPFRKGDQNPVR